MSYVVDHYYVNESIFYLLEFIITLKYTCIENACIVYQNCCIYNMPTLFVVESNSFRLAFHLENSSNYKFVIQKLFLEHGLNIQIRRIT